MTLAVCPIWDRGTEEGLPDSSRWEGWQCWPVSVTVRWSGGWSNKWQMALSGNCLWFLRVESSNLTGCQHSGSRSREGVWEFHHPTRGVYFIPFWVLLSLAVVLSAWRFESWIHPERIAQISCGQSVLGSRWIEKERDSHFVTHQRGPLLFQTSSCFGLVPLCTSPSCGTCCFLEIHCHGVCRVKSTGCLLACPLTGTEL